MREDNIFGMSYSQLMNTAVGAPSEGKICYTYSSCAFAPSPNLLGFSQDSHEYTHDAACAGASVLDLLDDEEYYKDC